MTHRSITIALAALLATAAPAKAGSVFYTGNLLLSHCNEPGSLRLLCFGYVAAIADMIGDDDDRRACVPKGAALGQVSDVVIRYLRDHPEIRHYPAPDLVVTALAKAFLCQ